MRKIYLCPETITIEIENGIITSSLQQAKLEYKYSSDDISLQQITIPLDLKQYTIKEGDAATAAGKGDDLWSSDLE